MKKFIHLFTVLAVLLFSSCDKQYIRGAGPRETVTRDLSGFTVISATGNSNVYITQGAVFKVEVKGYSNLLPHYKTNVVNQELQLGFRDNVNVKNDDVEVFITMPSLIGIKIEGSGDIRTTGNFNANDRFTALVQGSGNIHVAQGSTKEFHAVISGSGRVKAINMIAEKADIQLSGSGDTEITATQELKVKISGSGNVYYNGAPQIIKEVAGTGKVLPK